MKSNSPSIWTFYTLPINLF